MFQQNSSISNILTHSNKMNNTHNNNSLVDGVLQLQQQVHVLACIVQQGRAQGSVAPQVGVAPVERLDGAFDLVRVESVQRHQLVEADLPAASQLLPVVAHPQLWEPHLQAFESCLPIEQQILDIHFTDCWLFPL